MAKMLLGDLRKLIREEVIDFTKRLDQKRADAFQKKIAGLAGDITNAFADQREQEILASEKMGAIESEIDRMISKKRMQLAVPGLFGDGADEWSLTTPVITVISNESKGSPHYELLRQHVRKNRDIFSAAVTRLDELVTQLEKELDSMRWPAPWRRYTDWGSFSSTVTRFIHNIEDMLG